MKKAMTHDLLRLITIAMGTLILAGVFIFAFVDNLNENEDIELCRYTFSVADLSKVAKGGLGRTLDFDCKRREIEFGKDDLVSGGTFLKTKLKHKIAEEIRICNYMTNEGRVNPFEQDWATSSVPCLICSEISFDDGMQEWAQEHGQGEVYIENYLKDTDIGDTGMTYWDYIEDRDGKEFYYRFDPVDPGDEYYVFYGHHQTGKAFDKSNLVGWAIGFVLIGEEEGGVGNSGIYLVKKEDFGKLGCIVVN